LSAQNNQTITPELIATLFESTKSCPYCGEKILDKSENIKKRKTLDHLIPLSKGGLHAQHNILVCCHQCNSKKRDKSYPEWLNCLDEPRKSNAEKLYVKQYGTSPLQGVLPLTFEL
jgi:5-methylcytosine-specific restriction endonuclease McrA